MYLLVDFRKHALLVGRHGVYMSTNRASTSQVVLLEKADNVQIIKTGMLQVLSVF